jgi:succinate dehydrogenase/fumarate reductase flavoprotein subunit
MASTWNETITCDVLVVGGGGAGLAAAVRARERGAEVVLASKSRVGYGNNTFISKAAFAAARGEPDVRDNPDVHLRDRPVTKTYAVSPTAHFCMGGLVVGRDGATELPGVFAAGEVCAGAHGANRLAGNALAEVFVMGGMAGRRAAEAAAELGRPHVPWTEIEDEEDRLKARFSEKGADPVALHRALKELMWQNVGIVRDGNGLEMGLKQILELKEKGRTVNIRELKSLFKAMEWPVMIETAEAVCSSALLRTESRGAHYRRDYPEEDDKDWLKNIVVRKISDRIMVETVPVSFTRITPTPH